MPRLIGMVKDQVFGNQAAGNDQQGMNTYNDASYQDPAMATSNSRTGGLGQGRRGGRRGGRGGLLSSAIGAVTSHGNSKSTTQNANDESQLRDQNAYGTSYPDEHAYDSSYSDDEEFAGDNIYRDSVRDNAAQQQILVDQQGHPLQRQSAYQQQQPMYQQQQPMYQQQQPIYKQQAGRRGRGGLLGGMRGDSGGGGILGGGGRRMRRRGRGGMISSLIGGAVGGGRN